MQAHVVGSVRNLAGFFLGAECELVHPRTAHGLLACLIQREYRDTVGGHTAELVDQLPAQRTNNDVG